MMLPEQNIKQTLSDSDYENDHKVLKRFSLEGQEMVQDLSMSKSKFPSSLNHIKMELDHSNSSDDDRLSGVDDDDEEDDVGDDDDDDEDDEIGLTQRVDNYCRPNEYPSEIDLAQKVTDKLNQNGNDCKDLYGHNDNDNVQQSNQVNDIGDCKSIEKINGFGSDSELVNSHSTGEHYANNTNNYSHNQLNEQAKQDNGDDDKTDESDCDSKIDSSG